MIGGAGEESKTAAGVAIGFLDIRVEIGDLDWKIYAGVRFDRHDTDLPEVRHRLFRRRRPDRPVRTQGALRGLQRAVDGLSRSRRCDARARTGASGAR